ncbi:MAG: YfhO family protein [Elusimicrobia bacterium]|nr:YfhO family protein [Elusimicrobiota bacterium]
MRKSLFVVLFFLFLVFVFLPKIILMTHIPITPGLGGSDITDLNFPYRHLLSQSLKKIEIPVWSDLVWCGYPLHAEGQGGFFYPPNILIFSIFSSDIGFNLSIILNFILCGFFSFLFFSEIGLKKQPAIFSATIFSFSGFFFCHIQHLNMLHSVIWFPLIFYFIEKYLKNGNYKNIAGAGISFGIQILAGFPQFAYYTLIFSFLYFVFNLKRQQIIRIVFAFLIFVIVGLGISAVQWLPTLELVNFTARKIGFAKDPARWWWAYNFSDLITWIFPFNFGTPFDNSFNKPHSIFIENSFYIGKIAFIIGLVGLFSKFKKYFFFAVIVFLTFIVALSSSLGITGYLDIIPGFEQFRLHQRLLIFAVFSLSLFAGLVIDKWKNNFVKFLIFGLVATELFYFANKQNAFYKRDEWMSSPPVTDFLKNDKSFYRVWSVNSYNSAISSVKGFSGDLTPFYNYRNFLQPNSNIVWNIPAIEGHGGLRPKRFYEIWEEMMRRGIGFETLRFIGFAGGKYVITTYNLPTQYLTLKKEFKFYTNLPTIKVYENKLFTERAFFVNSAVVVPNDLVIQKMFEKNFVPSETVVLEEMPFKNYYAGKGFISIKKYSQREIEIEATSSNGGFLVLADTFYPGWRVFIDGKESKIYQANYIFRAVEIPKGKCVVRFEYKPFFYAVGKIVTVISIFCLIFYFLFGKIKKTS